MRIFRGRKSKSPGIWKPLSISFSSISCWAMWTEEISASRLKKMKSWNSSRSSSSPSDQAFKIDNSLNLGADDYLTKPFINEELLAKVRVMLRIKDLNDKLKREKDKNILLSQALEKRYSFTNILGKEYPDARDLWVDFGYSEHRFNCPHPRESGTGKELIARAIHFNSHRKTKPFVVTNCSAYSQNLLESELFGHEKGSFTGAIRRRLRFEMADGGTIFLDEIGEVSLPPRSFFFGSCKITVWKGRRRGDPGGEREGDRSHEQKSDRGDEEGNFQRRPFTIDSTWFPFSSHPFVREKMIFHFWHPISYQNWAMRGEKKSPVFPPRSWRFPRTCLAREMSVN